MTNISAPVSYFKGGFLIMHWPSLVYVEIAIKKCQLGSGPQGGIKTSQRESRKEFRHERWFLHEAFKNVLYVHFTCHSMCCHFIIAAVSVMMEIEVLCNLLKYVQ